MKKMLVISSFVLALIFAFMPLTAFAKEPTLVLFSPESDSSVMSLSEPPHTTAYVQTPTGVDVLVKSYIHDLSESQKEDIIDKWDDVFEERVLLLSEPTMMYNCHSYAWYSQDYETNLYWMDGPYAYFYGDMSSYRETYGSIGDIIVYFNADGAAIHSGIVVAERNAVSNGVLGDADLKIVQSKWGPHGLYTHRGDECPYLSTYSDSNKPADHAAYVKYYERKNHEHSWLVEYNNDDWDKIFCTSCSLTMYHELSTENLSNTVHTLNCSFCGEFNGFTHQLSYIDAQDDFMHRVNCSLCGIVNSFHHECNNFVNSEREGYHKGTCTICNGQYYQAHSCTTYTNSSISGHHQGTCTVCEATVYDLHNWVKFVGNKYKCTICNYVTTNISALKIEDNMLCLE